MKKIALVLPGAGSRGPFQVGYIKAIADICKSYKIKENPFKIYCGISAGSITSTMLASYSDDFYKAVDVLDINTRLLDYDWVFKINRKKVINSVLPTVSNRFSPLNPNQNSFLDSTPQRDNIFSLIPFDKIENNIKAGFIDAASVTTTHVKSGLSTTFFQADKKFDNWQRHQRVGLRSLINADHLQASCAIPGLFPAISIDGKFFFDGGVRNIAPLSPALHLGAEKIMLIHINQDSRTRHLPLEKETQAPSLGELGFFILEGLMSDGVHMDLDRIRSINEKIKLSKENSLQGQFYNFRPIDVLDIRPELDFNTVAMKYRKTLPISLKLITGMGSKADSSLLSYLMFHPQYLSDLIDLGYKQGMENKDQIAGFLELDKITDKKAA